MDASQVATGDLIAGNSRFEDNGKTLSVQGSIVAPSCMVALGGSTKCTRSAPFWEDSNNPRPDLPVHHRIPEDNFNADSRPIVQHGDTPTKIGPRYIVFNGVSYLWLDGTISTSPSNSAANSTEDTEGSQTSVEQICVYTVVAFAAFVVICISACAFSRCTRPHREARKRMRAVKEDMQRRQMHDVVRANHRAREVRQRERRAQRVAVEAVTIEMTPQAGDFAREISHDSAVTTTEELALGASAEVFLTRPEPALHRRLSMTASLDIAGAPATPLPKYEREDPLQREEATADFYHMERSPSYVEGSSSWETIESAQTQSYFDERIDLG